MDCPFTLRDNSVFAVDDGARDVDADGSGKDVRLPIDCDDTLDDAVALDTESCDKDWEPLDAGSTGWDRWLLRLFRLRRWTGELFVVLMISARKDGIGNCSRFGTNCHDLSCR